MDRCSIETVALASLAPDVAALFDAAQAADVQSGLDWYRHLAASVFASRGEVGVWILRRDGRPVAALPFVHGTGPRGRDTVNLANYYTSLFVPALAGDIGVEELAHLFRQMRRRLPRARAITISPLARETPAFEVLRAALARAGLATFDYFCFGNWYLPVDSAWPAYLAGRPGEVRSTIKRMTRRFESEGGSVEIVTAPADVARAVAAYQEVYAASWKQPEPHPEFMPGLIALSAERGWLRLGLAWKAGEPIAAQLWMVATRRASIYKLAYKSEFARLSPGTVLTARLMQQALDVDGVTEVDYLTGDDAYKQSWMTHRRERWGLVAYDPLTVDGAGSWLAEKARRKLKPLAEGWRRPPR